MVKKNLLKNIWIKINFNYYFINMENPEDVVLEDSGMDGCFYCHFEEKKRPIKDFTLVRISNVVGGGVVVWNPEEFKKEKKKYKRMKNYIHKPDRFIPRALCNECIKAGRTLENKYDKSGNIKPEYTEFSNFRG